ncbi:MAG: phosphoglycerate kinase [Candidatus Marinimicrobia bacterium]|nr:phosphoglycerate kinase [Candidatus Neomarinimicrobiota bacterium]
MKNITELKLNGKRVLIRVDYNVPLNEGIVVDDFRIKASLPTIKHCLNEGASVVLMSHLGRPNGKIVPSMSLDPVAFSLEDLLERDVMFSEDCISDDAIGLSQQMLPREVHLLENLRFHNGETENDPEFSSYLGEHADIYINDAFGTAHRSHASNVGVASIVNETAMGFLMEKELKYLGETMKTPGQPFVVILGGAKIGDKIPLIENMIEKADAILIGGAMAFTFLKVQGKNVGASLIDENNLNTAEAILILAEKNNTNIVLPVDVVAGPKLSDDATWRIANLDELKTDEAGYDIGPETTMEFEMLLSGAKTIFWNGPLGVSEIPAFSTGTQAIASAVIDQTEDGAISIIGGGDTASALKQYGLNKGFTHISTGGGASLQLMSGKQLPALEALQEYYA